MASSRPGAVVDDSAFGCDFRGALLLALSSLLEIAIAENLQIDQAQADAAGPEHQDPGQKVESFVCAVAGCSRCQGPSPLDKHGGPTMQGAAN